MAILSFWCKPDTIGLNQTIKKIMPTLTPKVEWRILDYKPGKLQYPTQDEIVVVMGADAYAELKGAGHAPKNRSVSSMRGQVIPYAVTDGEGNVTGVGYWMCSFAPGLIHQEWDKRGQIIWDAMLAHRYLTTKSLQAQIGHYEYTHTLKYVLQYLREAYEATGKPQQFSFDLETMGLYPYYPDKKIVTVQATVAPGVTDVLNLLDDWAKDPKLWNEFLVDLRELLTSPHIAIVGANLKFDLNWIRCKFGIVCTNFRLDTTIVGSLLDENRSNGLNWHTKEYAPQMGGYDDAFSAGTDKGKMEKAIIDDPKGFLVYAGGDTDAAYRVADAQKELLKQEPALSRFYTKLLHPAARAFEAIEYRGMIVDLDKYQELENELISEITRLEKEALAMIPGRIKAKHAEKLELSRGALIKDFLFVHPAGLQIKPLITTEKTGEPATHKAHLMMFADHPEAGPFIKVYQEWNKCLKMLSTYVHGFLEHLRPDGRFHPTYMLFNGQMFDDPDETSGTDTGRLAAKGPAVQTIPKHDPKWAPKLRECFPAPPGYVFWSADYNQGELRVAACVANEETMLEAYATGMDLHAVTGAKLGGYEYDEFIEFEDNPEMKAIFKLYRQRAKASNFGLLYGMGVDGYREYARVAYRVIMTEHEASMSRNAFFELYPALLDWHDEYRGLAKAFGSVTSPLGRIRHLPLIHSKNSMARSTAERQAINSPIQGTLSDLCIWAGAILEEEMGGEDKLWIAGATHDNLYGYCPENKKDEYLPRVVEVMSNLPIEATFGWKPQIRFTADLEIGKDMAEAKKA